MSELDDYIRLARQGKAPVTKADLKAERNHRKYLELKARDPDYYTKQRRMERKQRKNHE